ncbi:MAG TPA: glycine oxidase ThiO [Blastocatellia bacterium]|nr:glycine oxidase ThiO [Blastocatellia bacterium]
MTRDAIIVGGGIIGCSIGLRLAQAGMKVTILDRGRAGCEASRAAAGMLSPQTEAAAPGPFFDLCLRSRSIYPAFAEEIRELSGIDPQYRDEGALSLALSEADQAWVEGWSAWQAEAGLAIERLPAELVRQLEPSITGAAGGAVFVPGDHQVDNRLLMDGLVVAALSAGVEIAEGKQADALLTDRGRIAGVRCEGESFSAGWVIVASGCWSSALLETAGLNVEIRPARGQMVALRGDRAPIRCLVHSIRCYLVPRLDGRILIGATVEYTGYRKAVTAEAMRTLLGAAIEIVPALDSFEIEECWSGLRPDTPDHLPVLGPAGPDNLVLATGHFRNGILLAPITAQLISDLIVGGRREEILTPFLAERFAGQSGGEETTGRRSS